MKKYIKFILIIILSINKLYAQVPAPAGKQTVEIVLKNATVHDGNNNVLNNTSVVLKDGVISQIGDFNEISYNSNAQIIDITGKHLYLGLILPISQLGLSEIGSVRSSVDTREIGALNPNVRSIVAYNTDSELIPTIRSNGVLVAQVIPSGSLIAGSSSVVQLDAWNWEDAIILEDNVIHMNWPSMYEKSRRSESGDKIKENKNYKKQKEVLRKFFDDALIYSKIENPLKTNVKLEAMKGLFDGSKKLFINTSVPKQIIESVNFTKSFGISEIVLTGINEDAWLVKDFIKENNIAVILNDLHGLPNKEDHDVWINTKLPVMFYKEGIKVAISVSWLPIAINYPFKAASASAYGLTKEETLQLITKNPADIIGVGDKLGTIEIGKDATVVISEGDILDIATNNIVLAFINGRNINLDNRHKYLYRKFKAKYE